MTTQVDTATTTIGVSNSSGGGSNNAFAWNLAGSKLRQRLGSQLNESSGSGVPAFAKAQLEKLGWKEGEGLGKRRQGMASHIQVVKRAEGLGLGESTLDPAIHQSLAANDWWKHSVGDTLAKLSAAKKKKTKKNSTTTTTKKNKNKKTKDGDKVTKKKVYTDEELFEATGGARFGMRAQTQQHAKWKRAESNISTEEEEEAKRNVEWDGMTAPKVVLKEDKLPVVPSTTPKEEDDDGEKTEKEERKRQKKEKKKRQRQEAESLEGEEDTSTTISMKKSKKSKKQKISTKEN